MVERTALTGLMKFYFNVESAYYELMDSLDDYVPVYNLVINPLEDRKIPSFPVFAIITLAIIAGLFGLALSSQAASTNIEIMVRSTDGTLLSGVTVVALDGGREVNRGTTEIGRLYLAVPFPLQSNLVLRFEKDGFETLTRDYGPLTITGVGVELKPTAETQQQLAQREQTAQQIESDARDLAAQGYPQFQQGLEEIRSG